MKRFLAVFIIGGFALLSACGGDKPPITPPVTPPVTPPPSTGVVTPIGENIGAPVTETIGVAGGVVTLGKVTVSAPSGAFNGSSLRLQAISDTFNDAGQGIAISSDVGWNKYLTVTLPIDPIEDSPESLSLAVQQSDGSWRSLEPVNVDVAAGTVSAGLPAVTEVSAARVRAQAGLDLKRVIAFKKYYFKPPSATVKVGKTQTFVPFAQVLERPKGCAKQPPVDPTADLAPLIAPQCLKPLEREYPFTNDKDNFARAWYVDGIFNGNGTVGTITRSSGSGATYTAPDKKPNPDTVTVSFQSIQTDTLDSVSITPPAKVKIIGDAIQTYAGSFKFSQTVNSIETISGVGEITWKRTGGPSSFNSDHEYAATGSVQVTRTRRGCSPVSASFSVSGVMYVYDPVVVGPGEPFASRYFFDLGSFDLATLTAQCGNPPNPETVFLIFGGATMSPCAMAGTLNAPKYTDVSTLSYSGVTPCSDGSATATWEFAGN